MGASRRKLGLKKRDEKPWWWKEPIFSGRDDEPKVIESGQRDIILFFPPLTKSESYGGCRISDKRGHLPPLGMIQLASVLLENGFSVDVIDPLTMDLSKDGVLKRISEMAPPVIGINALTSTFHKTIDIASSIRKRFPDKILIVGGTHATIHHAKILDQNPVFDFAVIGEGEVTLIELMNFFKAYDFDRDRVFQHIKEAAPIRGLVYREQGSKGKGVFTGTRPFIDLDILPLPARQMLPMEKYVPLPIQSKRLPVAHMMISRGCPWNCSFCCTPLIWGKKVRYRSPEKTVAEIKHLMKHYGTREISFWDDTLTADKEWLTKTCDMIRDENLDIVWTCFGRVNNMTPELARKMEEGGCWEIFLGIESIHQPSLNLIRKGHTPSMVRKAVKYTKDAGIEVRGLFMLALPDETPEIAMKTVDFAIELDVDYAQFTATTPHKGTDLYSVAKQYGTITEEAEEDTSKWTQSDVVFVPYGYKNKAHVEQTIRKAFRRFYLRPGYLLGRLKTIKGWDDVKRYLDGLQIFRAFAS